MGLTRTKQSHESMISGDGSGRCWVDNPITYFHICENHKNKIANFFKLMLGPVGPVSVLAARKATLGMRHSLQKIPISLLLVAIATLHVLHKL